MVNCKTPVWNIFSHHSSFFKKRKKTIDKTTEAQLAELLSMYSYVQLYSGSEK